jgi:hypothetical protein
VQLLGCAGERVAGVAEPVRHLLPAHPTAPLPVVGHDVPAAFADRPGRDWCCLDDPAVAGDLEAEAGPRQLHLYQPHGRLPPLLGRARRASSRRRRTLGPGARGTAAVEGRRGNKLIEIGEVCPLTGRAFFRPSIVDGPCASPSTGQRRSAGRRLGAGFPGAARAARGRSTTPPSFLLLTMPWVGKSGAWESMAGPCCGELGMRATHAPGARRRGRRACAPPAGAA